MKKWLWIVLLTVVFSSVGNTLPHIELRNSYLLKPNQMLMGLQYGLSGSRYSAINSFLFMANYGVNENVTISFQLPYLYMFGDSQSGGFGDMDVALKFSIANSDTLMWRLFTSLDFRFGSGINKTDSTRKIGEDVDTYYPLSTGTFSFSPSVLFNLFVDKFMINLSLTYHLENDYDESPFTFDLPYDRIHFQLSADYAFKFVLEDFRYLIYRPAVFIDTRINLTDYYSVPSGIVITLENVLKIIDDYEFALDFSLPILGDFLFYYDISLRFGKYF